MANKHFFFFAVRTFRRFLVSYALILLLPILIGMLVHAASIQVISREIGRANHASLEQMQRILDARLGELFMTADLLSISEKVQRLAVATAPVSTESRYAMIEVQGLLRQFKLANSFIDTIYLDLLDNNYVLSSVSRYKGDEFALEAGSRFGMTMDEWRAWVSSGDYRRLLLMPLDGSGPATFVLSQKLVFQGLDSIPAVLVITVDARALQRLLDTLKWNEKVLLAIEAPDGSSIAWPPSGDLPAWLRYEELGKHKGIFEGVLGGERSVASTLNSAKSNMRYAYVIPTAEYLTSVDFVKRIVVAYVVLCLLGGFALSYYLARRDYTPIRRLTQAFLERLGGGEAAGAGDYGFLEESLQRLLKENSDLESAIRGRDSTMRSALLSDLIRGEVPRLDVLIDACKACGLRLLPGPCLLMTIVVDNEGVPVQQEDSLVDGEAEGLLRYMLQAVLDELGGDRFAGYVLEYGGATMCLLTLDPASYPDQERIGQAMVEVAERIRVLFRGRLGLGLSIALSGVHGSLGELPSALREAGRIAESMTFFEKSGVMTSVYEGADSLVDLGSSLALHRSVAENARAGNLKAVREDVSNFLRSELSKGGLSLAAAKMRASGIVNMILDAIFELRGSLDEALLEDLDPVGRLEGARSLQDLEARVEEIFSHIEASLLARKPTGSRELQEKIARYVAERYADVNLSVNSVADEFGLSLPHVSRLFKRMTGVGLHDYIQILRVKEAKRLIGESGLSVQEVARRVGCGSRVTLVRAFKRYEGENPSSFRRIPPAEASQHR